MFDQFEYCEHLYSKHVQKYGIEEIINGKFAIPVHGTTKVILLFVW